VCGDCSPRAEGCGYPRTLRALEQGLRFEVAQLDRLVLPARALAEAEQLVDRFLVFHVGIELASARFVREMIPQA
jgi:hypothetical protein